MADWLMLMAWNSAIRLSQSPGFPLMDMAAQRIRIVAADGIEQAREAGDVVFHLLFAGVLQAQEFGLDFADVPGLFGELQAEQPHIAFEDADEGAEAFVAAVARQLVGDGREPESQRNVAVGKDAHALKGQGESAVQAAFRASGGVQVALAPGDQETQRAFHADDAARPLLAEIVADGLGDGGAVVEGHVRSPEPREGMGEAARRGVPDEKAHEFVPHGIRQARGKPTRPGLRYGQRTPRRGAVQERRRMASCGFPASTASSCVRRGRPAACRAMARMAWGRFRERGMDTSKGRGGRRVRMRYMAHGERQNRIWSYRDIRWE